LVACLGFFDQEKDNQRKAPIDPLFSQAASREPEETKDEQPKGKYSAKEAHPAQVRSCEQIEALLNDQ